MERSSRCQTPVEECIQACASHIINRLIKSDVINFDMALVLLRVCKPELSALPNYFTKIGNTFGSGMIDYYTVVTTVDGIMLNQLRVISESLDDQTEIATRLTRVNKICSLIADYTKLLVAIGFIRNSDACTLSNMLEQNILTIRHGARMIREHNSVSSDQSIFRSIHNFAFHVIRCKLFGSDKFTLHVKYLKRKQRNEYMVLFHEMGIPKMQIEQLFNVSRSTVKTVLRPTTIVDA